METLNLIKFTFEIGNTTSIKWRSETVTTREGMGDLEEVYEARLIQEAWGYQIRLRAESRTPRDSQMLAAKFAVSLWSLMDRKFGSPTLWTHHYRDLTEKICANLRRFGAVMAENAMYPSVQSVTITIQRETEGGVASDAPKSQDVGSKRGTDAPRTMPERKAKKETLR